MQRYKTAVCQINMKKLLLIGLGFLPVLSCTKDNSGQVEIYLLSSAALIPGQCAVNPATAVLESTAFIKNDDLLSYDMASYNYTISATAIQKIAALQPRAAFAFTVNKEVIFYGINMPMTLSSSCHNSITMSALSSEIWLRLGYPGIIAGTVIDDQRNNARLIDALRGQGKLR